MSLTGTVQKLKVGVRLFIAFSVVSLILIIASVWSYYKMDAIGWINNNLYYSSLVPISEVSELNSLFFQDRVLLFQHVGEEETDQKKEVEKKIHHNLEKIGSVITKIKDEKLIEDMSAIGQLSKIVTGISENNKKVIALSDEFASEEASLILMNENKKLFNQGTNVIQALKEQLKTDAGKSFKSGEEIKNSSLRFLIIISAIGIFISLLFSTLITRSITAPLNKAFKMIQDVQQGRLDVRISLNMKDEIGTISTAIDDLLDRLEEKSKFAEIIATGDLSQSTEIISEQDKLGKSLSKMAEQLSHTIGEISVNADTVAGSAEELSAISSQIASNTNSISSQSDSVAGAVIQMTQNIGKMAESAVSMNQDLQSVSTATAQMSANMESLDKDVNELSKTMENVSEKAKNAVHISDKAKTMSEKATGVMGTLESSAGEIGAVTDMIKKIAEQTNLLALNANIEAASAGEAGKGFAVVANEIKELAGQSATAAEEIAQKITGIQENTSVAVESIGHVSQTIKEMGLSSVEITDLAEEQSATTKNMAFNTKESTKSAYDIANVVDSLGEGANEVARSAADLEKGSNEISDNLGEVNKSIAETSQGASNVSAESKDLTKIASQLQYFVQQFTIRKLRGA